MGSACSNGSTKTTDKPAALTSIARQGTATTNVSVESIQIGSATGFSRVPQSPGIPFGCNPPGVPSTATVQRPFPAPAGPSGAPPHEFPPQPVQTHGNGGNFSAPEGQNLAGQAASGTADTEGSGATDEASGSEDASENDRWTRVKLLGQGGFGSVYLVRNNKGQELAVKVINFDSRSPTITKNIKMLQKELTVLRKAANHHNLIRYIKAQRVSSQIHIFMEFCPRGSLRTLYKERKAPLTLDECRMYTRDILQGLEFLHSQNVIHRDVKCDNVLIGPDGFGKLADFGAATTVLDQSQRTQVGSVYWMAPEILFNKGHRWHADIWSTGCTVMEMASARPPHSNRATGYNALFAYIQDFVPENAVPPEITQPDIVSFIVTCLQPDREKRPSTTALLQHPLVAGISRLPAFMTDPAAIEGAN